MPTIRQALATATVIAASAVISTAAQAVTTIKLTPVYGGTVTGSTTYTPNKIIDFKFTVAAPYSFTFTATGSGGTFIFPIAISASGTSGTYTEVFGPFPVSGTVDYSLTTAVPEPGVWLLLVAGFGLVGVSARRRSRALVA